MDDIAGVAGFAAEPLEPIRIDTLLSPGLVPGVPTFTVLLCVLAEHRT